MRVEMKKKAGDGMGYGKGRCEGKCEGKCVDEGEGGHQEKVEVEVEGGYIEVNNG